MVQCYEFVFHVNVKSAYLFSQRMFVGAKAVVIVGAEAPHGTITRWMTGQFDELVDQVVNEFAVIVTDPEL